MKSFESGEHPNHKNTRLSTSCVGCFSVLSSISLQSLVCSHSLLLQLLLLHLTSKHTIRFITSTPTSSLVTSLLIFIYTLGWPECVRRCLARTKVFSLEMVSNHSLPLQMTR